MENPSEMEVSSWENHLFLWAILYGYVKYPEGTQIATTLRADKAGSQARQQRCTRNRHRFSASVSGCVSHVWMVPEDRLNGE